RMSASAIEGRGDSRLSGAKPEKCRTKAPACAFPLRFSACRSTSTPRPLGSVPDPGQVPFLPEPRLGERHALREGYAGLEAEQAAGFLDSHHGRRGHEGQIRVVDSRRAAREAE